MCKKNFFFFFFFFIYFIIVRQNLCVVHEWSWACNTDVSFLQCCLLTCYLFSYSSFWADCKLTSAPLTCPCYLCYFIQGSAQLSPWQRVLLPPPLSKVVSHLACVASTLVFNCNHHLISLHKIKASPIKMSTAGVQKLNYSLINPKHPK